MKLHSRQMVGDNVIHPRDVKHVQVNINMQDSINHKTHHGNKGQLQLHRVKHVNSVHGEGQCPINACPREFKPRQPGIGLALVYQTASRRARYVQPTNA